MSTQPATSTWLSSNSHTHLSAESTFNSNFKIGHQLLPHVRAEAAHAGDEGARQLAVGVRDAAACAGRDSQTPRACGETASSSERFASGKGKAASVCEESSEERQTKEDGSNEDVGDSRQKTQIVVIYESA